MNKINWQMKQDKIFRKMAAGEKSLLIACAAGVNIHTFNNWKKKPAVRAAYEAFLRENGLEDKSRHFVNRVNTASVDNYETKPIAMQNKRDEFKEKLKIGQSVKNYRNNEVGVVIALYPNVFTILTVEGWKSSYTYNAFMEFNKGVIENGGI